jgi:trans-aconitate methyltransferase
LKYFDAWQGQDGIRNVMPQRPNRARFPEKPGFDPIEVLRDMIQLPVVEVGCAYGRLTPAFPADEYVGLDINEAAIKLARAECPGYSFHHIDKYDYPPSKSKLIYTVAMHIPDEEYPDLIEALCDSTGEQVVVAEIMNEKLRKPLTIKEGGARSHATFGRDMLTHENEFLKHGWQLVTYRQFPYPGKGTFTFADFRKGLKDAA